MDLVRWKRTEALFSAALDLPPSARGPFVSQAPEADTRMRDEVRRLLDAHGQRDDFLEPPAIASQPTAGASPEECRPGLRVGSFCLDRPLARGGMGTVWLAKRADGEFEQTVAIKFLAPHLLHSGGADRFRREVQTLARLEHPAITRLIDGGSTPGGLPWFATEYVPGVTIDHHCEAAGLSLRARVELVLEVCDAVRYAHQSLVVHQDIKPANLLVDPRGRPKLLDFGLAHWLSRSRAGTTNAQPFGWSPGYASPEQMRGDEATTAVDVYALGALLVRLATGRAPGARASHAEDEDPKRRSRARENPDLRAIASKAMRPDPSQRYGSVQDLALDLRRFLDHVPVEARPKSLRDRLTKFVRRRRGPLLGATLVAGITLAGIAGIARERLEARANARLARQTARFLESVFVAANPYRAGGTPTIDEVLTAAADGIAELFPEDPAAAATAHFTVARAYGMGLWEWAQAERHARRAVELHRRAGTRGLEFADAQILWGRSLGFLGQARAIPVLESGLALARELRGDDSEVVARGLTCLAFARWRSEDGADLATAELENRRAIAVYRELTPPDPWGLACSLHTLGAMRMFEGRPSEEVSALFTEAARLYRAHPQWGNRHLLSCLRLLARCEGAREPYDRERELAALEDFLRTVPDFRAETEEVLGQARRWEALTGTASPGRSSAGNSGQKASRDS